MQKAINHKGTENAKLNAENKYYRLLRLIRRILQIRQIQSESAQNAAQAAKILSVMSSLSSMSAMIFSDMSDTKLIALLSHFRTKVLTKSSEFGSKIQTEED